MLGGIEGSEQPTGIPPPNRLLEVTIVCIEKIKLKDIVLLATAHTHKKAVIVSTFMLKWKVALVQRIQVVPLRRIGKVVHKWLGCCRNYKSCSKMVQK